jgi:hypothetical protein
LHALGQLIWLVQVVVLLHDERTGEHVVVGRLAKGAHRLCQRGVTGSLGEVQHILVQAKVRLALAHHLTAADHGVVQVRPPLHGQHPQRGAPGLADEINLRLVESSAQVARQFNRVRDGLVERESFARVQGRVGLARPALIPVDNHKVLLQVVEQHAHIGQVRLTGPTAEVQQHWLRRVLSADHQPLLVSADPDTLQTRNAA